MHHVICCKGIKYQNGAMMVIYVVRPHQYMTGSNRYDMPGEELAVPVSPEGYRPGLLSGIL